MATYADIAKEDIQELFNDRKTMNQFVRLKLAKNIQDCPAGKDLWTSMAHLVDTWDKILEIEELKNSLVDYNNPTAVVNRVREIKSIFNMMTFPKWEKE
jgi:hypothetical protein